MRLVVHNRSLTVVCALHLRSLTGCGVVTACTYLERAAQLGSGLEDQLDTTGDVDTAARVASVVDLVDPMVGFEASCEKINAALHKAQAATTTLEIQGNTNVASEMSVIASILKQARKEQTKVRSLRCKCHSPFCTHHSLLSHSRVELKFLDLSTSMNWLFTQFLTVHLDE